MTTRSYAQFIAGLTLLACAFSTYAVPQLNGLAENIELNKERFLAGLFTDNPSTSEGALVRNVGERSMELRVTAPSLSARALRNMWIQSMAINNSPGQLREEAENTAKMANMVRRSLVQGDRLRFDSREGEGMTVTLNGIQLGVIESENFFSMVLRSWIGSVPLSSDFKENLLAGGKVNQDLLARWEALEPTPTRIAAIEAWGVPAEPAAPAAPTRAPEPVVETPAIAPPRLQVEIQAPPPEVAVAVAPTRVTPPPANDTVEALRQQNPDQVAASLPANRPGQNQNAAQNANPTDPGPQTNPGSQQNATAAEPVQVAQANRPTPTNPAPVPAEPAPEDDEEEEVELFSAEAIFARQDYIGKVRDKTARATQYPERAVRRQQEGTVLVTVTLDPQGKIVDTNIAEESRYGVLNRAALESFERAAPYDAFPEAVTDDTLQITVPVRFQLQAQ